MVNDLLNRPGVSDVKPSQLCGVHVESGWYYSCSVNRSNIHISFKGALSMLMTRGPLLTQGFPLSLDISEGWVASVGGRGARGRVDGWRG